MEEKKFPVFCNFLGPVESPEEVWATRVLGPEVAPVLRQIAAWVDEVASGVETVRVTPGFAHVVHGLRAARKGLAIGMPPDRLSPRDVLLACAHAQSLGVELLFDEYPPSPPGPPSPPTPEESWLRWQFTVPPGDRFRLQNLEAFLRRFSLFPLHYISAPYLQDGRPLPYDTTNLYGAVQAPVGRAISFVISPEEDWPQGDHLLVCLVCSRSEPYWVLAVTLTDRAIAQPDIIQCADTLGRALLEDVGAHGGFLHPLGSLVWDNVTSVTTWQAARREHGGLARADRGKHARIDVERLATHEHVVGGISLIAAAMMWLGANWHELAGEERLASFADCDVNRALGAQRRLITLADPRRPVVEALVARQWAYRSHVEIEKAAHRRTPSRDAPHTPLGTIPSGPSTPEELKRRLELARLAQQASRSQPMPAKHRFSMAGGQAAGDAAQRLRFTVKECMISESGLKAREASGVEHDFAWTAISAVFARQLPVDPPFERVLFFDIVPLSPPGTAASPLRLLPTTRVNYAALPGGAGQTAVDNIRRLGRHIVAQQPGVQMDAATRSFVQGGPPTGLAGMGQFAAYDSQYR